MTFSSIAKLSLFTSSEALCTESQGCSVTHLLARGEAELTGYYLRTPLGVPVGTFFSLSLPCSGHEAGPLSSGQFCNPSPQVWAWIAFAGLHSSGFCLSEGQRLSPLTPHVPQLSKAGHPQPGYGAGRWVEQQSPGCELPKMGCVCLRWGKGVMCCLRQGEGTVRWGGVYLCS